MRRLGLIIGLMLAGCAGAPSGPPHVTVQSDQFSKIATLNGPMGFDNPFGGTSKIWNLRSAAFKDTGESKTQVYVRLSYMGEWRYYEDAASDEAQPLKFDLIDRQVDSCSGGICSFSETFGAEVPLSLLQRRAADGFKIKVTAHSGDYVILPITPEMISLQMAALRDVTPKSIPN